MLSPIDTVISSSHEGYLQLDEELTHPRVAHSHIYDSIVYFFLFH